MPENAFCEMLDDDLRDLFLNPEEFGEVVTISRGDSVSQVRAMFDSPSMQGQNLGSDASVISHQPRIFFSVAELPENKVEKGDIVTLCAKMHQHKAGCYEVVDFAEESDGMIVCHLHEVFHEGI